MKLFLRLALVAVLLFAQTAGIAHQAWHDADAVHTGEAPKKSQLCDFHTALGSVLGVVVNTHATPDPDLAEKTKFVAVESRAARFSLLASRSRGPPALL